MVQRLGARAINGHLSSSLLHRVEATGYGWDGFGSRAPSGNAHSSSRLPPLTMFEG